MKIVLGSLASLIALVAYALYLRNIARGSTKPHAFSWLLWALLTGMAFLAQALQGGGAGGWVTGFSSLACLAIGLAALRVGDRQFHIVDWLFLCGALWAMVLWVTARDVTLSVIALTVTDVLGYGPTFRKSWERPNEDMATSFTLNAVKYVIAILALESYSLATWLYPASLVIMNGAVAVMLLARRKQLLSPHTGSNPPAR